ncbi:MAG: dephospho-CoA kinase, partial [bacterium]
VVTAPIAKRLEWLKKRDDATTAQIQKRIAHQIPVEEKAELADYVINNDSSFSDLEDAIYRMLDWLHDNLLNS